MEEKDSSRRVAIIGAACSVLWMFGLTSIVGIILGVVARAKSDDAQTRLIAHAAIGLGVLGLFIVLVLTTANR